MNKIWISTELEDSLGGDLWTQTITLTEDTVTAAPQETRESLRETRDQTSQILLAGCSLAELSLAELSLTELSLAKLSLTQPMGYD